VARKETEGAAAKAAPVVLPASQPSGQDPHASPQEAAAPERPADTRRLLREAAWRQMFGPSQFKNSFRS